MEKSKYDFDGFRCKAAINCLTTLVENHGTRAEQLALDALCLDIEDLHRRAVERDDIIDACWDAPAHESKHTDYVELEDLRDILRNWMPPLGGLDTVDDLNL